MKKKIVIASVIIGLLISLVANVYFYSKTMDAKREAGAVWKESMYAISQTLDDMKTVDLNEAAKTEEGRKYIESIAERFFLIQLEFVGEANELLDEIDSVLEKAIDDGNVSEEDLSVYKEAVGILDEIVAKFSQRFETNLDWYYGFTDEKIPNVATQIIEETLENRQ